MIVVDGEIHDHDVCIRGQAPRFAEHERGLFSEILFGLQDQVRGSVLFKGAAAFTLTTDSEIEMDASKLKAA